MTTASAETTFDKTIQTEIKEINNENLDQGKSFVIVLTVTDYMTATEWNNSNYKWLNDEYGKEDRSAIDYDNQNVANAILDTNLSAYNFDEMIIIDGQTLAEFGQTHAYKLVANKRTRVHTLSIDFAQGVLSTVETVEIKAGCQLPTLAYAYRGDSESSCLEVSTTQKYMRSEGTWVEYFEGYAENTEYKGNENTFRLSRSEDYKGNPATPLSAYTDFFVRYAVQGEYLDHKVLVSDSNTEKDNLMVLSFVHPIDAKKFAQINLRVYINHQVNVATHNAGDITQGSLGATLESFTVGGGMFSYLSLTSAFYANDKGMVETIVFRFEEDCDKQYSSAGEELYDNQGRFIRDTFHFLSFNLSNPDLITKDSLTIKDGGDVYNVTFRFNKAGEITADTTLDTTKVTLNDVTLAQLAQQCPEMTANWVAVKGIYQINVTMPKSYTGAGCIKNQQYEFANNHMGVAQGLVFPNGDVLDKSYACHIYSGEKILDLEMSNNMKTTKIGNVQFYFDGDSANLTFVLYFDKDITYNSYYHACEIEHWRSNDLYKHDATLYESGISEIFVKGGYKSSLLNNVIVNGMTLGEWHAFDSKKLTNVQVHYGKNGHNAMSIVFAKSCPNTYDPLYELIQSGEGLEIEVKSGLKFLTNIQTTQTQVFYLKDGKMQEKTEAKGVEVYFNGMLINDGDLVTVQTAVTQDSIAVVGADGYNVTSQTQGSATTYTIVFVDGGTFTFSVKEDLVKVEKSGCGSSVSILTPACIGIAALVIVTKRKSKKGGANDENCK